MPRCRLALGMLVASLVCLPASLAQTGTQTPLVAPQAVPGTTPLQPAIKPDASEPITLSARQARRYRRLTKDWAQLGRYRKDDQALPPPAPGEHRVVFMGDSITDRWGRLYGKFFPGEPYINRGISGQTTPQMLVRFQQDVVDLHPAAVLILGGINDIAGNTGSESLTDIENNFRSMVEIAKANHIRVIIASLLPASRLPWRPTVDPGDEVRALNEWLQKFAHDQHLVFCNYYPALVNKDGGIREDLAADKAVHPNDAGYAIMAPIAEAAIRKSLATPRP